VSSRTVWQKKNKQDGNIFLDAGQKKYHGKTSDKKKAFFFLDKDPTRLERKAEILKIITKNKFKQIGVLLKSPVDLFYKVFSLKV